MDDDQRLTDDISQLWGAEGSSAWEPAPLRRPDPHPKRQNGNGDTNSDGDGNGQGDRLDALEEDVRALVRVVERVEALVNERLSRLEQQVAEATAKLPSDPPRAQKGIGRISGVIRSTRGH